MKVSIVTVCLNNEDLEKTIASVLSQTSVDYECWVMDGLSDNKITIEILNKYQNAPRINIQSEKDEGIYDAMNKGISLSNNEYLLFLNAGDYFCNNSSLEVLLKNIGVNDIIYGDIQVTDGQRTWLKEYPSNLTFKYFLDDTLPHPAALIRKSLFKENGGYETSMQIVSDWAFFIKAICLKNAKYKHIPSVISIFNNNGISSMDSNRQLIEAEKTKYLLETFPSFIDDYKEIKNITNRYNGYKNSRVRKYLSYIFKQLCI